MFINPTLYKNFFKAIKEEKQCLKNYDTVHSWFLKGGISENDWDDFCVACLEELMTANKNILEKLKEKA